MEHSLTPKKPARAAWNARLNPYSNGILSDIRCGCTKQTTELVLILILMEYSLTITQKTRQFALNAS